MKDGFLQGPGIAYRTNTFDESRKTLIFIHGLSGTCSAWKEFEDALQNEFNIVTYDLRGHGLSKRYPKYADYDPKEFAEDLHLLTEHLGIKKCELIAHSMGATVALSYLHYFPGTAQSVLFLAPNYKQHSLGGSFTRKSLAFFIKIYALLPFSPRQGRRADYSNFGYSPDISLKRIAPEIKDMTLRLYFYCLEQLYEFAHDEWWKQITIPATIVHGTRDTFVPYRLGVELSEIIPNAQLVTIEKANHMLVLNNKDEIIKLIKKLYGL